MTIQQLALHIDHYILDHLPMWLNMFIIWHILPSDLRCYVLHIVPCSGCTKLTNLVNEYGQCQPCEEAEARAEDLAGEQMMHIERSYHQ